MKKYQVNIITYSWTVNIDDTSAIEKFRKFVRREHLQVVQDKYECNQYSMALPDNVLKKAEPFLESGSIDAGFEHRYWLLLSYCDLVKIHRVLSLIQSYTAYLGIHCKIFSLKCVS